MAYKRKTETLMQKNLLIVFAKNKIFGKVKTRLAQTIGHQLAYEVYEKLFHITERESCLVNKATVQVYYSHEIDTTSWDGFEKFVQEGDDLGERMKAAFEAGFKSGYTHIIGIGADLPEIKADIIENAFTKLNNHDFVFGPAEDGGYYLVGTSFYQGLYIFENKPWSTPDLLDITTAEIFAKSNSVALLGKMNDIDTIADLEKSNLAQDFAKVIAETKV